MKQTKPTLEPEIKEPKAKKLHLGSIILLIIAFLAIIVIWARFVSTIGLLIKEYNITSSRLPASFHGLKIIHFSDTHFGRTINRAEMERLVNQINRLRPHIVVFTGDLIDKDVPPSSEDIAFLKNILGNINVSLEKIAVKGNHDYDNDYFEPIMEGAGFTILHNEAKFIYYRGTTPILIKGLPSITQYTFEPLEVENQADFFQIVLAHEPDAFNRLTIKPDLMFAGHSHGGQIRLPFWGPIHVPVGARSFHEERYFIGDSQLFVSSGLGTSQFNFRFFNRPSFNFYRFYAE